MFTFCVLGHNEAPTVLRALAMAQRAAKAEDGVLFVDSGSTDDSAALAAEAGYEVVSAPVGKGRAVAAALRSASTQWVCLLDADIYGAERNIALTLAERAQGGDADMLVGEFSEPGYRSILSNTWGIYEPLTSALFPEVTGMYGTKPLSGFRALRTDLDLPEIPGDFGVEAYLNLTVTLNGKCSAVVRIGDYEGRFRYKPKMGLEIAGAILDTATRTNRLSSRRRAEWDEWVAAVVDTVASYHGTASEQDDYLVRLRRVIARPLPPTGM